MVPSSVLPMIASPEYSIIEARRARSSSASLRPVLSRILHWMTLVLLTSYTLLTNSTAIFRPSAVSSGRSSYRIYSFCCNSSKLSLLAMMSLNSPISQIFFPRNCSCENPNRFIKNGFASTICPVSASRISMPSCAASKRRRYRISDAI